ncbi:sodium channel protein Nach [Anastrepha obliqua]|uniref:sodium channel protein Nach n=1 Tax=Anastrepha obliqua TaxID=95512 RepID=UPI00240A35C8|nr:sodium channel protein Nach [Anastrepha obliqua]
MDRFSIYLRQTYRNLLKEFLNESGMHGLKLLLYTSTIRYAKYIWLIFLTSIIVGTYVIIINLIIQYLDQPTEVLLSTKLVHVSNSPFPAVAICSANKISRHKLMLYAAKVYKAQEALHSGLLAKNVSEMAEQLMLLTGFFLYPFDTYSNADPRLRQLHDILTSMYNGSEYSTREILYNLAPHCEDIIIRGMVFGKPINTTRYFQKRSISAGACCLFNYRRESYVTNITRATLEMNNVTFESNSILNSIQFVLQSDPNDYTHSEFASYAFQLYLFPQQDYPTSMTNTLGEILVNPRSIMQIPVQPTFYEAPRSISSFSPAVRECYFKDEGQQLLNRSYYSLDECLLICRMRSMQRYCGCVNPMLAPTLINATACSLTQLPCLTRWMRLFNQWSYFEYVDQPHGFDKCKLCMPTCNGINYKFYNNYLPLREATDADPYTNGLLKGLNSVKTVALVKLYFKQKYAESTRRDVIGDWVMLLSRFGGILSLFYGFSILSFIEIIYFISGKWFVLINKAWQLAKMRKQQQSALASEKKPVYTLYWNELQPPSVKLKKYPKNIIWINQTHGRL